jgi:hypothetical protein
MEAPTSLSSIFTTTRAPTINVEGDFAVYERDVRLWSVVIDIAEVKKGSAVLDGLCSAARTNIVVIVMSAITAVLLVSRLPSLFYTMSSHRDIYIYEC